jgi:hypothetical protein
MASDFKIFTADPVKDVGKPIVVVVDIRPVGTTVVRIEWYLFVMSHTDALGDFASQVVNSDAEVAKEIDPTSTALGEVKNAFANHQLSLMKKTGKPDNLTEVDLVETEAKLLHLMWSRGVAHDKIRTAKDATKSTQLYEYLLDVSATPVFKRNTESPYPAESKPDTEQKS